MPDALRHWGRRALPSLPPLSRRARFWLVAIVAVGAVLRVVWALQAQSPVELRDPVFYLILAEFVSSGDGYTYGFGADQGTTAYYPPGYPLALAAVVWTVGLLPGDVSTFDVAIWLNVALSVATIGLVFVLGRRLADVRVGLAAAAIWALWPNLVFHSGIVPAVVLDVLFERGPDVAFRRSTRARCEACCHRHRYDPLLHIPSLTAGC